MKYYSAIGKKESLSFSTTQMELEGIILSQINQMEKDKYCTISLICGTKGKKSQNHRNRV